MEDIPILSASPPETVNDTPKLQLPKTCNPPSETNPAKQAVWVIFGATGHMGQSIVRAALEHGDRVAAVGWRHQNSQGHMEHWQSENSIGLLCDVRVRDTVDSVYNSTMERFGRIDIVANCTGYGVIGACEDQDEYELRNQFETNFFGVLHIIQLALPIFRSQNQGRFLIFSSTSGALGVPGLGPYCATKYAVEGLIESMLYEVDAYNIKATLVEPGHMRRDEPNTIDTESVKDGMRVKCYGHFLMLPYSEPYSGDNAPASHAKRIVQWLNDRQPTSVVKSAELIWQLGHCSFPPLRLLLGTYAVESIRDRLRSTIEEIEDWKHLSFPTDAEEEEQPIKDEGE
ncbi:NAD(P)-binding protein [Patellaria atrata CBS 101060]|uniref:NAD(P)-binding protein n=1 Tax=Patellaria atrata CBS 101060 TaxID=1346257 RepID=A0A9P4SH69_9PEZI|nr:NAD(P)-binding protein [Patellaria atrata CBS 101060]